MDVNVIIAQVLELDTVKDLSSLNFESVIALSFEVAGLVKKAGASSKEVNVALLVQVLDAVILHVKAKAVALADPANATAVGASYDALKENVDNVAPVLFLHLPHLKVPKSFLKAFSCCSGSAVVKQVDVQSAESAVNVAVSEVANTTPPQKEELVSEVTTQKV